MFDDGTNLTPELQGIADDIARAARDAGLDFFTTLFQVVDYKQLNEIAAYGGFPTRYPHWRYAMDYERLSKGYTYGLSTIYEMVINTDPCYAYLMRANNLVYQKTVIAHVYAHCDFFKNNYWFSKTNRKMLDQMANHASFVRKLIEDIGHDEVESFIDTCLSLENLIDIHAPFKPATKKEEPDESFREKPVAKLKSKKYMDSYVNPKEFLDGQRKRQDDESKRVHGFPDHPERDVLKFLMDHAPVATWQKRILEMIRDEAYYFAPQGQTKIMNEGWATYWHSQLMTKLAPLSDAEIIDYCDHYAGVVYARPGQINPYKMGVQLFRFIEERWNRGRFGIEYSRCDDPRVRAEWGKNENTGLGRKKIFEARAIHNDVTFIDEFLDEDFCHEFKLFVYDFDKRTNKYVITSRNLKDVKAQFLRQLTNFGQPVISVVDGNFANRGELLLRHQHEENDLQNEFSVETLKNLYRVWQRPVHIETILEGQPKRVSFDGTNHSIEKV